MLSGFVLLTVVSSTFTTPDLEVAGSLHGLERRDLSCDDGSWCNDYCVAGGYEYWICSDGYVLRLLRLAQTK
jgi:hypothetical protein